MKCCLMKKQRQASGSARARAFLPFLKKVAKQGRWKEIFPGLFLHPFLSTEQLPLFNSYRIRRFS